MDLSEEQAEVLKGYLAMNPRRCPGCGGTDWTPGERLGELVCLAGDDDSAEPTRSTYVELTCRRCGHGYSIGCAEAGITGYSATIPRRVR